MSEGSSSRGDAARAVATDVTRGRGRPAARAGSRAATRAATRATTRATTFAGLLALGAVARAHVAPSTDTNNRYLKVELREREVRLAYTIYFGELPGSRQRRLLDRDRDGTIAPAEAREFGDALRAQLAASFTLTLDGAPADGWTLVDVGLGTTATTGGAFSVDLELRRPLSGGPEHLLTVADRLDLPAPGEAQLRVEPAPGVTMLAAHTATTAGIRLEETSTGGPLPAATIRWRAAAGVLDATRVATRAASPWRAWLGALAVFAAVGLAVGLGRRRR